MKTVNRTFESERLYARLLDQNDKDNVVKIYSDPRVMKFIDFGNQITHVEDIFSNIIQANQSEQAGGVYWAIVRRRDEQFVGIQGLNFFPQDKQRAEIGIMFFPEYSGAGLASEALSSMVSHAFNTLGCTTLIGHYDPHNNAVMKLASRLKFDQVTNRGCEVSKQNWKAVAM